MWPIVELQKTRIAHERDIIMLIVQPTIDSRIYEIAPGYRAISISVQAAPIVNQDVATRFLEAACKQTLEGGPTWANDHLNSWAEVFKKFGVKPQRTPCSAEALRKRIIRDGQLPSIDPIVDLYNAISLLYTIPVGGENFAKYIGVPRLTVAAGTEQFDTMKDGSPATESPEKGEIIWRDDKGVTCRR